MTEQKTRPTSDNPKDFIAQLSDPERREECRVVSEMMRNATKSEAVLWGNGMVGFGSYRYRYESGREGEWPLVGFSPRKNELALYLMQGFSAHQPLLERLGKHKTGKSCLYIKRLKDVDLEVLHELITAAVNEKTSQQGDQ